MHFDACKMFYTTQYVDDLCSSLLELIHIIMLLSILQRGEHIERD